MTQVLAQSATQLTKSNGGKGEADYPFAERVLLIASRKANGITRERMTLNRQSLIDSLRNDYRSCFTEIYGKGERLPSDINQKIEESVNVFLTAQMARVNHENIIGLRRAFHWHEKDSSVAERITVTGENKLSLQEQHCGIVTFIVQAEKKLAQLLEKKTPDYEAEKDVKNRIVRLNNTKMFIEREIQHQQTLAKTP